MPAEPVLPEGRLVRTATGGTETLRKVLVDLRRYAFSGYVKTYLPSDDGGSVGYVFVEEGTPEMAIHAAGERVTQGKVALKGIWQDSYAERCQVEIHAKVDLEAVRLSYPRAQLERSREGSVERESGRGTADDHSFQSRARQVFEMIVRHREAGGQTPTVTEEQVAEALETPAPVRDVRTNLIPQHTFETFVVGPSNRFGHAAALAVAKSPHEAYNPLFITSGPGLGKTHLLNAIGNAVLDADPSKKVVYATAEGFLNEFREAQAAGTLRDFRSKYRGVDLALFDDAQFLSGKGDVQEELFHTFNDLYMAGKQIVFASDRPPKEISDLEDRLVSRFESGLVADIEAPEYETRLAILRKKSQDADPPVGEDVLAFIASVAEDNVRELGGSLNRVLAFSSLMGQPVSLDLAREVLGDLARPEATADPPDVSVRAGHAYLVEEDRPDQSFRLVQSGDGAGEVLIITRQNPKRIREKHGLDEGRILWLTERESRSEKTIPPSLEKIMYTIEAFMEDGEAGVVLLDGVEYLVSSNGFDPVLKFLRRLVDLTSEGTFSLIVSISRNTLKEQEIKNLEREMEVLAL